MQTIEVFFWVVLVGLAVVLIASIAGCVIKAWYENSPKSFGLFFIVIGSCAFWYGIIELFSK